MVDPVQRTSSVPLPQFQTEEGAHNPLPLDAPKEQDRLDDVAKTAAKESRNDGFEDYLNQSGISTLEKTPEKPPLRFDPAAEIASGSVYAQTSGKAPL